MVNFIINLYTKEDKNAKDPSVRGKIGTTTGVIGIVSNVILVIIKIIASLLTKSSAVFVDAINNLFDVMSSIVTIIGFKIASKPADREHPYGHGRVEYFASLIVGVIILLVGWDFAKSSFSEILNPQPIIFSLVPFILLLFSAIVKIWLTYLNRKLGNIIDSGTLKATGDDAFNDVLTSMAVAISILVSPLTTFPVDGIIGLIVSVIIMKSAFDILKENINPLIGKAPPQEIINAIWEEAKSLPHVLSVHDLLITNFGPNTYIATLHMEFPASLSAMEMHGVADGFERKIESNLNVEITVHIDPVDIEDETWQKLYKETNDVLKNFKEVVSSHGHRTIKSAVNGKELLLLDVVYEADSINTFEKQANLKNSIERLLEEKLPEYKIEIRLDADTTPKSFK